MAQINYTIDSITLLFGGSLVPTNLFANTKLHAIIEQAVDEEGVFDPSKVPNYLQDADFCGMDRNTESVSQNVESTITLEGVSPANAQKILELCTTSANETEGIIYLNKSVDAELLGIAVDVLDLIAFDGSIMQNDPQGAMPFGEAVIQFLQNPLKILHGVLIAITNFIVNLLEAIFEWGMKILGAFAEGAAQAIEAAIKAIILVLTYLLLAIIMLIMLIVYGIFFIMAAAAQGIFDLSFTAEFFNIQLFKSTSNPFLFNSEINFEISWEYIEFIDLELPISYLEFLFNGSQLMFFNFDILGLKKPDTNTELGITSEPKPLSSVPEDISTRIGYNVDIDWELTPSNGASASHYQILKNGIIDQDWQKWPVENKVGYNMDTNKVARYNYTIVFNDSLNYINSDSVWVYVVDLEKPISDHPHDKKISQGEAIDISWLIKDTYTGDEDCKYRVFKNGTIMTSGTDGWVIFELNEAKTITFTGDAGLSLGIYNFTIEFEDKDGNKGNDTVWVKIIPSENIISEESYNFGLGLGLLQTFISLGLCCIIPFIPDNYEFIKFLIFATLILMPFFFGLISITASDSSAACMGYGTVLMFCGASFILSVLPTNPELKAGIIVILLTTFLDVTQILLTVFIEIYIWLEVLITIIIGAITIVGLILQAKKKDTLFMYAAGIALLFTGLFYFIGGLSGLVGT